jgi:hypothetical protein
MDPDLMGSTGVQLEPEELGYIEPAHEGGIGAGGPAGGADDHSFPVPRVPGDRRLDADRAGVQVSPGQCRIAATDSPGGNGRPEAAVGQIGLGYDHETRSIAIQAMDDAGPSFGASRQSSAPRHQRVDQGVVPMSGSRVNYQSCRLVDDGEVLILEHDGEGDGAGLKPARRFVIRKSDRDPLTAVKKSRSSRGLPIDADELVGHQPSRLSARQPHLVGKESVEALSFRA